MTALQDLTHQIAKRISVQQFCTIEELKAACRFLLPRYSTIVVEAFLSNTRSRRRVISLCCAVSDHGEHTFSVSRDFDEFISINTYKTIQVKTAHANIYITPRKRVRTDRILVEQITTIFDLMISATAHFQNNENDRYSLLIDAINKKSQDTSLSLYSNIDEIAGEFCSELKKTHPFLGTCEFIDTADSMRGRNSRALYLQTTDDNLLSSFRTTINGALKANNLTLFDGGNGVKHAIIPMIHEQQDRLYSIGKQILCGTFSDNASRFEAQSISLCVRAYIRSYKERKKDLLSRFLEGKLHDVYHGAATEYGWAHIHNSLRDLFAQIAPTLLFITNSHSAVLRFYRANEKVLRPSIEVSTADDTSAQDRFDIHIRNIKKSCNVFTFLRCSPREASIYIPDIHNIPTPYLERGLNSVMLRRSTTRSELTLPLFFRATAIGTINLESSRTHNYNFDRAYVERVVNMLGRFAEAMVTAFDARWISSVSQSRAAIHEARQIVHAELHSPDEPPLNARNRKSVEELHRLIEIAMKGGSQINGDSIATFIQRCLNDATKGDQRKRNNVFLNLANADSFNVFGNEYVSYIVKEIIINFMREFTSKSHLEILFYADRSEFSDLTSGVLQIETSITNPHVCELEDFIGLQPLRFDSRQHSGLFLIGVLTRAAGGWLHVDRREANERSRGLTVTVRLPVK